MDDVVSHRTSYLEAAVRLTEVVTTAGWDLRIPVRGCPDWSARDMLGHLVGMTEDWLTGRLDHYGSTDWTTEQVRRHRGDDQIELFAAWSIALDQLDNAATHPIMGGVWRFLTGRADCELVRDLEWSHDPGSYLGLGLAFPFQPPAGT